MSRFKDVEHLYRFAFLFVVAFALFLVVRHFVVPKSFGEYGHYRGAAIAEIAAKPLRYAGHATCETCHADIAEAKMAGKHEHVNCEACHGPLQQHADDPSIQPAKLDTTVVCVRCHAASAAKPGGFPQIDPEQHAGGIACETCHKPHNGL